MSKASRVELENQRWGWMKGGGPAQEGEDLAKGGGGVGWDAQEIGCYLEVLGEEGVGAAWVWRNSGELRCRGRRGLSAGQPWRKH